MLKSLDHNIPSLQNIIFSDSNDILTPTLLSNATKIKLTLTDYTCSTSLKVRVLPYVSFIRTFPFPRTGVVLKLPRYTCSSPSPTLV